MIAQCSERIRVGMDITRRIAEDDGCICRSSFPGDFGRHRLIVDVGVLVAATTTPPPRNWYQSIWALGHHHSSLLRLLADPRDEEERLPRDLWLQYVMDIGYVN